MILDTNEGSPLWYRVAEERIHRYLVTGAGLPIIIAVMMTARTNVNQLNRLESKAA